ncbi:MAG: esterase/lipase family protein, partial [Actinomycetota bacterium]
LRCPATFAGAGEPVLLVHGLGATGIENWGWNLAGVLPGRGLDVCTVDLPGRAWTDIQASSEYVVHAVRAMAAATGRKVDVVGHSEGGLQPRWATRWWSDVRDRVDDIVTLGTPHHGVVDPTFGLVHCPVPCVPGALWQMREGSDFLTALNAGDETPGDVSYTSIWSATDELVQLLALGKPTSDLAGASNVRIQDVCPGRPVSHVGLAVDAPTSAVVLDALTHPGPADPARVDRRTCLQATAPDAPPGGLRGDPLGLLTGPLGAEWTATEPALRDYARPA